MKIVACLSLLMAAFSTPAGAVNVEVATGDWSKLPQLSQRGYDHLNEKMQAKLYEIADSETCPGFKLVQDRLNVRMSFAVQYGADGGLNRVIMPKLECPGAESVAAGALLEMLNGGDYAPSGKSRNGWYQGTLAFNFAGASAREPSIAQTKQAQSSTTQPGVVRASDPTEILCEKAEEIGTRLSNKRVCMTRAQWAEQKRLNRQVIDEIQTKRPCNFNC